MYWLISANEFGNIKRERLFLTTCTLICINRAISYLLSKDALIASLSYFFPLPPDFRSPLLTTSNIFIVGALTAVTWNQTTGIVTETYPKSGNRLLGLPAGEASFGSSAIENGYEAQ